MSGVEVEFRSVMRRIGAWVGYQMSRARRVTPVPTAVRVSAIVAALTAALLALPIGVVISGDPRPAVILAPAAICVGVLPRSPWVTFYAGVVVALWLYTTLGLGEPVHAWRVGALTAALFLMHSSATLAAVLPHDAVVAPGVLARWVRRAGAMLGVGLVLGLGGMAAADALPDARSLVGPIAGSLVAVGLAGLLAWHLRRR
jgi:hypothetical protein